MKKQFILDIKTARKPFAKVLLLIAAFGCFFHGNIAQSELSSIHQTPQEKEFYSTTPGNHKKGTILDATNPMDLMNRLRRATAMDNATSPSDAVDEALKALEMYEKATP